MRIQNCAQPKQGGGVHIMPTRMHIPILRRIIYPRGLNHRQCINIRSQQHRRVGILRIPIGENRHNAMPTNVIHHGRIIRSQLGDNLRRSPFFLPRQLGMPMQPAVKIPLPGQISGTDNSLNTGTHPTYLSTGLYFRLLRFISHSVAMFMVLAIFPSSRSRYMALTTLSRKSHGEIVFR